MIAFLIQFNGQHILIQNCMTWLRALREPRVCLYIGHMPPEIAATQRTERNPMWGFHVPGTKHPPSFTVPQRAQAPWSAPNDSVDMMVCEEVLHGMSHEDARRVLTEAYRCLKPGATLRLSLPDYNSPIYKARCAHDPDTGKILYDRVGRRHKRLPSSTSWFPTVENVEQLLLLSPFREWTWRQCVTVGGEHIVEHLNDDDGYIRRTPEHDARAVKRDGTRVPLSMVVDLIKPKLEGALRVGEKRKALPTLVPAPKRKPACSTAADADEDEDGEGRFVFIHLGPPTISFMCLVDAVYQARWANPSVPIAVCINHDVVLQQYKEGCADISGVEFVDMRTIPQVTNWTAAAMPGRMYRKKNQYWAASGQRYWALRDVMAYFKWTDVIHLESDVLVYGATSDVLPLMRRFPMCVPRSSDAHGIGSVVYVRDADSMTPFLEGWVKNHCDMWQLAHWMRARPDHMGTLPTLTRAFIYDNPALSKAERKKHATRPKRKVTVKGGNEEELPVYVDPAYQNIIFDAAAVGQYVGGGNDPRFWGKPEPLIHPGYVREGADVDPRLIEFHWAKHPTKGGWVPRACGVEVWNLHVACKQLAAFVSTREARVPLP
jgi:hypothetical protein